jgi:hypothetical protein
MVAGKSEVHATLKTHTLPPAHLDVWNDVIFHVLFRPTEGIGGEPTLGLIHRTI